MSEKTNYDNLQGQLPQELNLNIILTKKYLMVERLKNQILSYCKQIQIHHCICAMIKCQTKLM